MTESLKYPPSVQKMRLESDLRRSDSIIAGLASTGMLSLFLGTALAVLHLEPGRWPDIQIIGVLGGCVAGAIWYFANSKRDWALREMSRLAEDCATSEVEPR